MVSLKKMNMVLGYLFGVFFLDGFILSMASPKVHYYDFVLKESNFTRLCSTKSMLTVNGSFPGPVIKVRKGDIVYVNVRNHGKYGVTIHWHGVKQPRNPWYDGPENVTQCPIQPKSNFTYKVILSDEEGTLWWHAHSDWSRATVHGAFIILPASGTTFPFAKPYKQHNIILGSWFKGDVKAIIDEALETGGNVNTSDAHTINGQPGDLSDCSNETTYRIKVKYGKTYLLRIVNAVMNEEQFFAIANHNLTVVGQDGAYTKPITTGYLMITPGQTMDVLFTANQTPSYYYMASTPFFDSVVDFDNTTAAAIIHYQGNYTRPSSIPLPIFPAYNNETAAINFTRQLKSLASKSHPIDVPKNITKHIFITISLNMLPCANQSCEGTNGDRLSASLNNISFVTPSVDILEAYYRDMEGIFTKDFPVAPKKFNYTGDVSNITVYAKNSTKVLTINYGEEVEIVFQGTNIMTAENHPMHLHGFSFYVVGMDTGNFNNITSPQSYNLVDPPLVNTIGVPKNGWAAIRFTANNPGVWFMHCHLERHSSWGMDMVIVVKNGSTKATSIRPRPPQMPPCSSS